MALRIKAEYLNGTLNPLEPLELQDGTLVTLDITEEPEPMRHETILEATDRILRSAPADLWDDTSTDEAKNYRQYLYGYPKEEE